jgi:acyl carrier protein
MPAPTDTAALIAELKQVIITECDKDVAPEDIDENDRLIGGTLELDSLDALQLSLAVKERYGVRIEGGPDARAAFETLTTLARFIQARASG